MTYRSSFSSTTREKLMPNATPTTTTKNINSFNVDDHTVGSRTPTLGGVGSVAPNPLVLADRDVTEIVRDYLASAYMVELISCFVFAVILLVVGLLAVPVDEREVLHQYTVAGDVIVDLNSSNELVNQMISTMVLGITCFLSPLFLQLGLAVGFGGSDDAHNTACVYMICFSTNFLIVGCLKQFCGVLRPNFYAGCAFDRETLECTQDGDEFRKSFPSGHASASFSGMTLFAMYLRQTFAHPSHLLEMNSNTSSSKTTTKKLLQRSLHRLKGLMSYAPLLYSFFVAGTRVRDNYHFPADVVAGSLIGIGCATLAHDLWFPSDNWYTPPTIQL